MKAQTNSDLIIVSSILLTLLGVLGSLLAVSFIGPLLSIVLIVAIALVEAVLVINVFSLNKCVRRQQSENRLLSLARDMYAQACGAQKNGTRKKK